MENTKCSTILVFKDGKGKVRRTLEEFIQLQRGDFISLHNPIDSFSDHLGPNRTITPSDRIREGAYKVKGINRIYNNKCLEIEYFLSREVD